MKEIIKINDLQDNKLINSFMHTRNHSIMETKTQDFRLVHKIDSTVSKNSYFSKSKRNSSIMDLKDLNLLRINGVS